MGGLSISISIEVDNIAIQKFSRMQILGGAARDEPISPTNSSKFFAKPAPPFRGKSVVARWFERDGYDKNF
jgi:hypothetical protein